MIRAPGAFNEPRIHFAVNCASIGCPMLREEAFVADRLDAQLADATERFLSDRSRNRYEPQTKRLAVSKLFDWYGKDFEQGHDGIDSLQTFFARHASALSSDAAATAGDARRRLAARLSRLRLGAERARGACRIGSSGRPR